MYDAMEKKKSAKKSKAPVVVITGGCGFLGHALTYELTRQGSLIRPSEIRLYDLVPPDFERTGTGGPAKKKRDAGSRDPLVRFVRGDVLDRDGLAAAFSGADVVIHAAALIDWGQRPRELIESVNITGTENAIEAARAAGVRAFIFTSTMDVHWDGAPLRDIDESHPGPRRHTMTYARTKRDAESAVIAADSPRGMRTCVLRPCGMYGERDPYHVASLLAVAKKGRLRRRIGNGDAVFQHVYVGNVAHAHVVAARSLISGEPSAAGQAYLVTDHPPKNFFEYLDPIMTGLGYPIPKEFVPQSLAYAAATVLEAFCFLCRPLVRLTPPMNRTSVAMVCRDFTFNGDKLRRELGYAPIYSESEAAERTIQYFANA